jgi:hypothetical protein
MILGMFIVFVIQWFNTNMQNSVTCRLPQTPRSPHAAASHYFDDIWSKKAKGGPRPLRRSSTTRNIGNSGRTSIIADDTDDEDFDADEAALNMRRVSSIGYLNEEDIAKKKEMDEHVANYVSDQLQRMRSNDSTSAVNAEDEMTAQMDGTNEFEVQSNTPPGEHNQNGTNGHGH